MRITEQKNENNRCSRSQNNEGREDEGSRFHNT